MSANREAQALPHGSRSRVIAIAALALSTAAPRMARAASEPDIPLECGSRAAFDSELSQRLGDDARIARVHLSITQTPTHFHLRVQLGSEVRELDDNSCAELFRASVVVAVAMLMHSSPHREAPAPPVPAPSVRREYPRFRVGVGGGIGVGTLPNPVPALELEGLAHWQYLGVSINARYLAPTRELDDQQKGVELQALSVGLTGLFRPSRQWEARLGAAAQRLFGRGVGSIGRRSSDSVWVAGPTLGLGFVPVQERLFWAGLGVEGQLNALRGAFEILHYSQSVTDPPREIYRVPWIAGTAFVRLGLVW